MPGTQEALHLQQYHYDEFGMPLVLSLVAQRKGGELSLILALLPVSAGCRASLASYIELQLSRLHFTNFHTSWTISRIVLIGTCEELTYGESVRYPAPHLRSS